MENNQDNFGDEEKDFTPSEFTVEERTSYRADDEKVISLETATKEIERWLDYKKVNKSKREFMLEQITNLINAVCDGRLVVNEDFTFTQNLLFPIGKHGDIKEIKYRARLAIGAATPHLSGVKSGDTEGKLIAYAAALSNKPKEMIKALDSEDNSLAQGIAVFFM